MKILVLEASALHLGYLGCYGNDWVATPNLDRLAAEGITFDQHFADHPDPQALGSDFGRYGFADSAGPAPPNDWIQHEAVADLATFAHQARSILARSTRPVVWLNGPSLAPPWHLSADQLALYADEEDAADAEPLADPPRGLVQLDAEELDRLQTTYAAVVTFFDAQLGRIVDYLRDTGRLDDVLLCITAGCGLPLGEHDLVGVERPWLYEELVHVPLILRLPHREWAGLRVAALTQPVDLLPTLRGFLGVEDDAAHGRSLWPLIRGEVEQVRPYAVSALRLARGEEWLLRTPERALLLPVQVPEGDPPRRPQLYVKPDDRWEANDLSARSEEEAAPLVETLRAFAAAVRAPGPMAYPPLPQETLAVAEEAS